MLQPCPALLPCWANAALCCAAPVMRGRVGSARRIPSLSAHPRPPLRLPAGTQGGWLWTWKDRIDRAFMARFGADLDFRAMQGSGQGGGTAGRPMSQPRPSPVLEAGLSAEELALLAGAKMRCGGCGSKVGASSLSRVLRRLQQDGGDGADAAAAAARGSADGRGGHGSTAAAAGGGGILLGLESPDDAAVLEPPPPGHVTVGARLCVR